MSEHIKGALAFQNYFSSIYGQRWQGIYSAMLKDKQYCNVSFDGELSVIFADRQPNAPAQNNSNKPSDSQTVATEQNKYFIDTGSYFASVLMALLINKYSCNNLLDMCSAPGGKLLSLLHLIYNNKINQKNPISIIANDKTTSRATRLKQNIKNYFFNSITEANLDITLENELALPKISFSTQDASLFGKYNKDNFDFVILDAPCSNDRAVLNNKKELALFSASRCKRMAALQSTLLCAAIDCCKSKGFVMYLTCSLAPQENQELVARILHKRDVQEISIADITQVNTHINLEFQNYGSLILPDTSANAGPLYLCILQKN